MLKYNSNELQIHLFNREMNKISKEQAEIEHEKLRYSMIHKTNDDILHILLDIKSNPAKLLSSKQLEHMKNDISTQSQNLQVFKYQNIINELLVKGQKTEMELTKVTAINGPLENNIINKIKALTAHINHLIAQLQHLQQQNSQIVSESNDNRELK
jgi:hypothetical protein